MFVKLDNASQDIDSAFFDLSQTQTAKIFLKVHVLISRYRIERERERVVVRLFVIT